MSNRRMAVLPDGTLAPEYEVCDKGFVYKAATGNRVKGSLATTGYRTVHIINEDGVGGKQYVHRLVCSTFNGTLGRFGFVVDHRDGNRTNNAATNLRWVTQSDNTRFGMTGNVPKTVPRQPVINLDTGDTYPSYRNAAESAERAWAWAIREVVQGRRHTAGGYRWAAYDEDSGKQLELAL